MDCLTGFESTIQALTSLQHLLFCCQCGLLAKNVCTLGNCEHIFCKHCVEKSLGISCPVCQTPAHARDAQVNRQLSNITSLSLELGRLLQINAESISEATDGNHKNTQSSATALSPSAECIRNQDDSSASLTGLAKGCRKNMSEIPTQETVSVAEADSCRLRKQCIRVQQQKIVLRKGKKTEQEKLLMLPGYENQSHKTEETLRPESELFKEKPAQDKSRSSPQSMTGWRSSRKLISDMAKDKSITNERELKQSILTQVCCSGDKEITAVGFEEDNRIKNDAHKKETENTPQRRRRSKENTSKSLSNNCRSHGDSSGNDETSLPSSHKSVWKNIIHNSCHGEVSKGSSHNSLNMTSEKILRRKSTSEVTSRSKRCTPKNGRKSLPLTLSLGPKMRQSPQFNANPTKMSGRNLIRVKRNAKGETPLHVAAIKGNLSTVKELLDKGNNPNVRDNAGWTPLHEAVNHGHTAVAEFLLLHGAMVNLPGFNNDTPLHDAVANNRLDCVRLLLSYGASNSARNIYGQTAMELARTAELKAALQVSVRQPPQISSIELAESEEFLSLCFLGTALDRHQHGLLQKCATILHAKVVEDFYPEVTHVISSVNSDGQCPRTMKYLQAILGGKWIISMDWISTCMEYGEKVSEEPFEIPGSSTHHNSNAAHKARINHKLQLPALFDGCQVFLHGTFSHVPPSKEDLVKLLSLGGARFLTREPRLPNLDEYDVTVLFHASPGCSLADCGIFIIHDGGSKAPVVDAHRMRSVPASWVIACIATFSLVEPSGV